MDVDAARRHSFSRVHGSLYTIKRDVCEGVIAYTGANLMLAVGLSDNVVAAAAMSATIENSGQCNSTTCADCSGRGGFASEDRNDVRRDTFRRQCFWLPRLRGICRPT